MAPVAAASEKAALRARVRADRRARTAGQRAADAGALARVVLAAPPVAAARVVALHASTPTEPGTGPLRAALAARGVRVLLPVVAGSEPLGWVWDDAGSPGGGAPPRLAAADVVVLPALAVDAAGHRLGQGGGHYDRTLAALVRKASRLPLLVALVHDGELLPAGAVPAEPHDVLVDAAASPAGWRALR
jgi:5-formyltetrahydrofolate cyclo-ligase